MRNLKANMKTAFFSRSPFLIFLPFLLFFIIYILIQHNDFMDGDEGGYISFANNLIQGFYSPPPPAINLWWGPGYPIFLIPFIVLNLPLILITLTNGVLQYISIVLLYKSLQSVIEVRLALFYSLIWAFCISSFEYIHQILTEPLTSFLVASILYYFVKAFNTTANKYLYFTGLLLGFLALTKVVFGYLIFLFLIGSFLFWIFNRNEKNYKKIVVILVIAFLTLSPYLIYTYSLTGRYLYVGNSGGMSLYWMSNLNKYEFGDWNNETLTANTVDNDISIGVKLLDSTHSADLEYVSKFKGVAKDDAFKKIAVDNIKKNPVKYGENVLSNISRLFFGFPYTYTYQRPIIKVWYFAFIYFLILICSFFTVLNWNNISFQVKLIFLFALTYLALSSMVSVGSRQFVVIMPVLLFWISYIIDKSFSLKFKW